MTTGKMSHQMMRLNDKCRRATSARTELAVRATLLQPAKKVRCRPHRGRVKAQCHARAATNQMTRTLQVDRRRRTRHLMTTRMKRRRERARNGRGKAHLPPLGGWPRCLTGLLHAQSTKLERGLERKRASWQKRRRRRHVTPTSNSTRVARSHHNSTSCG